MDNSQKLLAYEPNTRISSNGLANMGIAIPGEIAAHLEIARIVVVPSEDRRILMDVIESETVTRLGQVNTIVVFDDDCYGLLSELRRLHQLTLRNSLGESPFERFAQSLRNDGY